MAARNDANRRLLAQLLREESFTVVEEGTLPDLETSGGGPLALALIDIDGFSRHVWDACEDLVEQDVPVVVIAGSRTDEVQDATLSLGVRTVLEKPLRRSNVKALVRTLT